MTHVPPPPSGHGAEHDAARWQPDPVTAPLGVSRVMGSETEYGIFAPADPRANATWLSSVVVHGYAVMGKDHAAGGSNTQWDYAGEDPLADARGWHQDRDSAHPSQLTDEPEVLTATGIALTDWEALDSADPVAAPSLVMNMVLGNGARLYVDHAHPEYSSPEVLTPRDSVTWDFAGDVLARGVMDSINSRRSAPATEQDAELPEILLYKNNTDGKNASYGSHENYLVPRSVPFSELVSGLTPFFVTRAIMCGAGRVGIGTNGAEPGFQISSRADFFEAEVGLETTIRRPIINTRDEPHAVADKYRRLHVIIGDANLAQTSHLLKMGTTSLVLGLIERGLAPALELMNPVQMLQLVSHDVTCSRRYKLVDGRVLSAVAIQRLYLDAARAAAGETPDPATAEVLALWQEVLDGLESGGPTAVKDTVEWAAKLALLQQFKDRDGLDWSSPRLAMIDLQWSDLRQGKNLVAKLQARGALRTLVSDVEIAAALNRPPEDTRAYFRGRVIQQFGADIVGASWDSVTFALPELRRLHKVATREPLRGTAELTRELFQAHRDVKSFLAAL